jgi:hypothetical protein
VSVAGRRFDESCAEIDLTQADRDLITTWLPLLDPEVEPIARRYYDHLKTTEVGRLLTADRWDQLLVARIAHWRLLLRGDFAAISEDYNERFGKRLFDAGFPQRIFVVASDWFLVGFTRFVDHAPGLPNDVRSPLRLALTKFAFLDLALAHASREVAFLD